MDKLQDWGALGVDERGDPWWCDEFAPEIPMGWVRTDRHRRVPGLHDGIVVVRVTVLGVEDRHVASDRYYVHESQRADWDGR